MTNPENKHQNIDTDTSEEIKTRQNIENIEKIPLKIEDLRNPSLRAFNLDKFIDVIHRVRNEDFYKLSGEFNDSDYGKYMSLFASSESNSWSEAIKSAIAIQIVLTTPPGNKGISSFKDRTDVEVKILMNERDGRIFNFIFDKDGKYHNCNWKDVNLQDRLKGDINKDTTFEIKPDLNELE